MTRLRFTSRSLPPRVRRLIPAAPDFLAPTAAAPPKKNKLNNRWCWDEMGVVYQSKLERATAVELDHLVLVGKIERWSWGPRFLLQSDPERPGTLITYTPDFLVWPGGGHAWFVVDSKGMKTAVFQNKVRMWKVRYPTHQLWLVTQKDGWKLA
jgi:hypothetical protein